MYITKRQIIVAHPSSKNFLSRNPPIKKPMTIKDKSSVLKIKSFFTSA